MILLMSAGSDQLPVVPVWRLRASASDSLIGNDISLTFGKTEHFDLISTNDLAGSLSAVQCRAQ